jgi:hypothetical protein
MAKKTKADLERLLYIEEQETRFLAKQCRELAEDLKERNQELNALEEKYNAFVANHRNICEAHATQMTDTEIQLGHAMEEIKKLRDKVTAQEGRVMVCETAMRSMTIHIALIEQQKGKTHA